MRKLMALAVLVTAFAPFQIAHADTAHIKSMIADLSAAPTPGLPGKTLNIAKIKRNYKIRRHFRGVDIDSIVFHTNSDKISEAGAAKLGDMAAAIKQILARNNRDVFLIEGHTDAPGKKSYNKDLSSRRAKAVMNALITQYGIPAANLTAAGYGEDYLKIKVKRSDRRNRRVTFRRIANALAQPNSAAPETTRTVAGQVFTPTLVMRRTLPFIPPVAAPPFVTKKPAMAAFKPTLVRRRALPFTPPMAMPPFIVKNPAPQSPAMARPLFRPTLMKRQTLPFAPPMAAPPFLTNTR